MSSLIANQVKTDMFFSFHTTHVPLFKLIHLCNKNYNYSYWTDTIIRYSAYNLFVSANLYSLDSHNLRTRNLS